jgi:nitroimidazol reductase NimA-like FMN-containing flavoprotein (pyridoxamine 5'-phosphate oxidase superfamily)
MVADLTQMESFLDAMRIPIRLACATESGWPMAVSLWFRYQSGQLFCATQKTARVVAYLQNDARCAFEIAEDRPPYCGVRGQAIARIDEKTGAEILEKLLLRYLGNIDNTLARKLLAKRESEVAIVLKPVQVFTWDFSFRMRDVVSPMRDSAVKICPGS